MGTTARLASRCGTRRAVVSAAADYLNRNLAAAVQIIGGEPGSTARTAKEAPQFIPITLPAAKAS